MHNLFPFSFVDGMSVCPPAFVSDAEGRLTDEINPLYETWIQQDQLEQSCLTSSLTPNVLSIIVNKTCAPDAWKTLQEWYASSSHNRVVQLPGKLMNMQCRDLSITDFLDKNQLLGWSTRTLVLPYQMKTLWPPLWIMWGLCMRTPWPPSRLGNLLYCILPLKLSYSSALVLVGRGSGPAPAMSAVSRGERCHCYFRCAIVGLYEQKNWTTLSVSVKACTTGKPSFLSTEFAIDGL